LTSFLPVLSIIVDRAGAIICLSNLPPDRRNRQSFAIVLYFQFIPYPTQAPYNLVGWIVVSWFVLGILAIISLSLRSPQALARGSEVYLEE
jgi:hypothetical protein